MIEDLLVINESGALLYNWHPQGHESNGNEDLLSGFLTALNSFTTVKRGEDIQSLKLKETQIIFERYDKLYQKLTFVITTKNEVLIEILHAVLHRIMEIFHKLFADILNKNFNGSITEFKKFDKNLEEIIKSYGLDILDYSIKQVDKGGTLKAIIFLEPKGGNIYFMHTKLYVNKDKISFLIPLIVRSAKLLYQTNLNEDPNWILFKTMGNEKIIVEPREQILIIKLYHLAEVFEEEFLSFKLFKNKEKYIKKPKIVIEKFESIVWDSKLKQISLIDMLGNVLYSKVFDESYDGADYIPETITFLTSSKKASEELFGRILFNCIIFGKSIITICMNFNNFCLTLIGNTHDFSDFNVIQTLCINIFEQLK